MDVQKIITLSIIPILFTLVLGTRLHHETCNFNQKTSLMNCNGQQIVHIPYHDLTGKSFHTLDLGSNNITSLATNHRFYEITSRDRIEVIYLDHNQISELPHNLFEALRNLRILDLSHNQLKHVSRRFCHMNSLTDLILDGNPIEAISKNVFGCLQNLQYLFLADCNLKRLPVLFAHGLKLRQLDLTGNEVENLDEVQFPKSVRIIPSQLQKYVKSGD